MEAEGSRGQKGRGVGLPEKVNRKSIVDSKVIMGLVGVTDDISTFRQWDVKLVSALAHLDNGLWVGDGSHQGVP